GITEVGAIKGVNRNALVRAIKENDIPLIAGSGVVTWRELEDEQKEKVVTDYTEDVTKRNVFAGMATSLQEIRDENKHKLIDATAGIQPSMLGSGLEYPGRFANEAVFFLPIMAFNLVDIFIEDFKKDADESELDWQDIRTGEIITNEEHEALRDTIESDYYVLSPASIEKMPGLSLPTNCADSTSAINCLAVI
ncbi:unnamed protein product, partial [marine sediment metagenome]